MLFPLPIDPYIPSILASKSPNLVISATPGSGKTTRIPPAIAQQSSKKVLCVEPRRLACISAAMRIAQEMDEKCGDFVGYHVRLDKKCSAKTKLCFVTTGMLLQYLCADPFLEDVSCIIFDEFHERSMDADVSAAMVRYLQREMRDDLRIFMMSATIECGQIADYLQPCEVFDIQAPLYPLEVQYLDRPCSARPHEFMPFLIDACEGALQKTDGDLLVFLTGMGDIRASIDAAQQRWGDCYDYFPCHASMPLADQKAILNPATDKRRIIFSTNVAESSLTVPRVHAVVDLGFAKRKFFDSVSGLARLETQRISRASADQRAGRAARLGPGLCIRLWNDAVHNQLEAQTTPEIERLDLSQACLQIAAWDLEKAQNLPFLTMPNPKRIDDAHDLLEQLGAIQFGELTQIGRQMASLPVEPRLARWLIAAMDLDCLRDVALLAAFLSEAPYRRSQKDQWPGPDLYEDFVKLKKNLRSNETIQIKKIADDILDAVQGLENHQAASPASIREALGRSLLAAYPDRLAQPRPQKGEKLSESDPRRLIQPIYARMSGNRGVVIKEAQTLRDAKFFLCLDLDLVKGVERAANVVHKAFEIDSAWIPWKEGVVARYEPDKDRVVVAQSVYFDIFTLRETFLHDPKYQTLYQKTLLEAACKSASKVLNFNSDAWLQFTARLQFIQKLNPALEIPAFDDAWVCSVLPTLCEHAESFADLYAMDITQYAQSTLDYSVQSALNQLAPRRIRLENGYETEVDYTSDPPIVRVKIQKAFGTYQLPRVGGGKIPVIFHLCAPNGRPAQVTQDLDNFWKSTYADVRKQLRGRYPNHDWPEKAP